MKQIKRRIIEAIKLSTVFTSIAVGITILLIAIICAVEGIKFPSFSETVLAVIITYLVVCGASVIACIISGFSGKEK